MNVVDNLNCVQVINKPCMRASRCVSLLPRTTLHSDSEQYPLFTLHTYTTRLYTLCLVQIHVTKYNICTVYIIYMYQRSTNALLISYSSNRAQYRQCLLHTNVSQHNLQIVYFKYTYTPQHHVGITYFTCTIAQYMLWLLR